MWEVKWFGIFVTAESRCEFLDEHYKGNVKAQYDKVPSTN